MRRFEFSEGSSHKFWEIAVEGDTFTVRFGKIGTAGQQQVKQCADPGKATAEAERLVGEKVRKGYREIEGVLGGAPSTASETHAATAGLANPPAGGAAAKSQKPPKAGRAADAASPRELPTPTEDAADAPSPRAPAPHAADAPSSRTLAQNAPAEDAADAPPVLWTDAMKKKTHGLRGFFHHPVTVDEKAIVARIAQGDVHRWLDSYRYDDVCGPHRTVLTETPRDAMFTVGTDALAEAMRARVFNFGWSMSLVPLWARDRGAAFAVDALVRAQQLYATNLWVKIRPSGDDLYLDVASFRDLRNMLAAASDADHDAALACATEHMTALTDDSARRVRIGLAYAFPERASWANLEAQRQLARPTMDGEAVCLLGAVDDVELLMALGKRLLKLSADDQNVREMGDYGPDMVANIGAAAVPVLISLIDGSKRAGHRQQLVDCLALIESDVVGEYFIKHLAEKHVAKTGSQWLTRHRDRFIRLMQGRANPPAAAAGLLLAVQPAKAAGVGATAPRATDTPSRITADITSNTTADVTSNTTSNTTVSPTPAGTTAAEDLPAVLVRPPWAERSKRKPLTVKGLSLLAVDTRVDWADGEREEIARRRKAGWGDAEWGAPHRTTQHDADILAEMEQWTDNWMHYRPRAFHQPYRWSILAAAIDELTDDAALAAMAGPLPQGYGCMGSHLSALSRFGDAAVPFVLRLAEQASTYNSAIALAEAARILSPLTAQSFARLAGGRKDQRAVAQPWLLTHDEISAIGVIPVAVGDSADRPRAEAALRFLARRGRRPVLMAVAARYGEPAVAAVAEILDSDVGFDKMPKMPPWWTPEVWHAPARHDGTHLPTAAFAPLGVLLAASTLEDPLDGLASVRSTCAARTLGVFAEDLFNAWLVAGGPPAHIWAFGALAHLGDEDTMQMLLGHMSRWPREGAGGRSRVLTALDVLAAHALRDEGTLNLRSLVKIQRVAQTSRILAIGRRALEILGEVAKTRGLTVDELEDRLVPTEAGDDREKVIKTQTTRLQQAMCRGRRWTARDFRTFLIEQPLLAEITRGLVWARAASVSDGSILSDLFEVRADGTLTDADGHPLHLQDEDAVGLPHPLEMADADVARWSTQWAERATIQPFPQLGREVYEKPATHSEAKVLDRPRVPTTAERLRSMVYRGWNIEVDDTWVHTLRRTLAGDVELGLAFEPGWSITGTADGPQTATTITASIPLGDLSPIAYSELVRDYEALGQ